MGAFEYRALDGSGREQRGVLEGDTPRQVRQLLRERALLPVKVTEVVRAEATERRGPVPRLRRGISALDLALVTRQLATLVRSGLPLEEALLAVAEQSDKPRLKSILIGVRSRVVEGHTLADGLADFPQAFPEIYRATVSAGEQSGYLDAVLERLADYTESRHELRQKVAHALIYPVVLVLLSLAIVSLLLTYVVPKVVEVFRNSNAELPIATRVLIAVSDFLRDHWLILLIVVIAAFIGVRRLLQRQGPRRRFHALLLRIPVVGRLARGINTARFSRTLSILAASAVPVLEALRIAGEVVINIPMREAVQEASARVREGAPIGKSLAASRLFPPMTLHLISSGEASGELETMLERAAINQEREVDGLIAALLGILQPALIVLMGLMVMGIMFALLLPIFQLNELIR